MKPVEPLPIHHSWPLFDRDARFNLGCLMDSPISEDDLGGPAAFVQQASRSTMANTGIGLWECDLSDNGLSWSSAVYDIFGLPQQAALVRDEIVELYCDESRVVMERLRAYAIRHKRGFTVDVEIRPAVTGRNRWMRLIAAPICTGRTVTHLRGLKQIID